MAEEKCPACGRKLPHEHEGPVPPRRERITISVPKGEEGVVDELLIQLVERYKDAWGDMPGVGERHWKYVAIHHALYSLVTASNQALELLLPSEEGG